jgi:hypothetical protein
LAGSTLVDTQLPPQNDGNGGAQSVTQVESTQRAAIPFGAAVHALPQEPQFAGSRVVSIPQTPLHVVVDAGTHDPLHGVVPLRHARGVHDPATHVLVPPFLAPPHAVPHAPQCCGDVCRSTHMPVAQYVSPAAQTASQPFAPQR